MVCIPTNYSGRSVPESMGGSLAVGSYLLRVSTPPPPPTGVDVKDVNICIDMP